MKTFFSHSKVEIDGKKVGSKYLSLHVQGVTKKALLLFGEISLSVVNFKQQLQEITKYHDLGKYTPHFQNYLLDSGKFDRELKQHARFGAFALFQRYRTQGLSFEALLACYIIVHHHSDLSDFSTLKRLADDKGEDAYIFEEQWKSIKNAGSEYLEVIKKEVDIPDLEQFVKFPIGKEFRRILSEFLGVNSKIEVFFLINYLFSLLIEADKLDASETEVYQRKHIAPDQIDLFLSKRASNSLRTLVRKSVTERLMNIDLNNQKIFTLTAPTGVGKTFTALDVALKLRKLVPKLENAQIIYALPFINIIEQGFDEYKKAIGGEIQILAHYQYAEVFEEVKNRSKNDYFNDYEPSYNQKLMELDTWQCDIVVTSFVQFFHTLIGYKNKLLKKFSHYANSIVILDEVQTLRLCQLPLIGATLYYLSKYLNTYVILMTATKPKLLELAYQEILQKEGEPPINFGELELLQQHTNIYASYKRTKIVPLINDELKEAEQPEVYFVEEYFSLRWSEEKSCLIVVNKVNRCIDLYEAIKKYLKDNNLSNPVYCLSTNIVPSQRFKTIQQIKADLGNKKAPILIATQVVEAGVDLNFDLGFRDIGPIDSIVQVAGRINREADPQSPVNPYLPLYIVDFGDCQKIYGLITDNQAKKALKVRNEFLESDYLILVEEYFDGIADKSSFDESKKIFQAMKNLRYDGDSQELWYYVSDFAIIEDNINTRSVFVLADSRAYEVKDAFEKLIKKQLSQEEFNTAHKRDFHQRVIAVPKYYTDHLEVFNQKLNIDYMLIAEPEHYNPETGFIRAKSSDSKSETVML